MKYSAKFQDYFNNTNHAGKIDDSCAIILKHNGVEAFDQIHFYLLIENTLITKVRYEAGSTPALVAAGEYVSRWLENKTIKQAIGLQKEQILQELELDNHFIHIADLIQRLISQLESKDCESDGAEKGNMV